ncbi:altronate oxidoreductase [Pedobacter sp. BAL39]|nr:altronate oxidoreductase [Pedobacter sp. BAL39]
MLNDISGEHLQSPDLSQFNLPEKVLQFGTGVLLRALPDYFINKANGQGLFNGRVVVVKSTSKGDVQSFQNQDGLYTICVRGLEQGNNVEENIISAAISRVVSAEHDFAEILTIAGSKELTLIVSNTTEVGIQFVPEDVHQSPPSSFPAKLLAVLYARFHALGDVDEADIVIVATELIPENGRRLHDIVIELCRFNKLNNRFIRWIDRRVYFCNSLVDRIVPGKPATSVQEEVQGLLGYEDQLLIMAEPYRLWAIEGDDKIAALIGLSGVDAGLIVTPDIEIYRELKVRLLNGTHTLSCGIAMLSGIKTVGQGMSEDSLKLYIKEVMYKEIISSIPYPVDISEASSFADAVSDRFANPYIEHLWSSITFQYTMKMKVRILPLIFRFYEIFNEVPKLMAFGFAVYLRFMRVNHVSDGQYFGTFDGNNYLINDDQAEWFCQKCELPDQEYIHAVMIAESLWGADLSRCIGFEVAVADYYHDISKEGVLQCLNSIHIN